MKKKILALALVVVLAVTAVTGATLAYFTDTKNATNTFTVGNVKIELTEPNWNATGIKEAENVYPGQVLAKDPTVTNTGANPCYVRVEVEGLGCLVKDDDAALKIALKTAGKNGINENWTEHDGYYYYNEVLAVGAKTEALFDQIVIPTDLTNDDGTEYEGEYNIKVTAYAVQSQGSNLGDTATVEQIADWFAKCAPAEWTPAT